MPAANVTRFYHQLRGRGVPARAALLGARSLSRVRNVRPADVEWVASAVRTLTAHQLTDLAGELVPPTYGDFGSVSSGSLQPRDLIPAFADALRDLDRVSAHAELIREADGWEEDCDGPEGMSADEYAGELVNDLMTALEEYAPAFGYFGAHGGDGADFGYWASWDGIGDAEREGTLIKVDAGDEWPDLAPEVEYVLTVTDHGNPTLYDRTGRELWALV